MKCDQRQACNCAGTPCGGATAPPPDAGVEQCPQGTVLAQRANHAACGRLRCVPHQTLPPDLVLNQSHGGISIRPCSGPCWFQLGIGIIPHGSAGHPPRGGKRTIITSERAPAPQARRHGATRLPGEGRLLVACVASLSRPISPLVGACAPPPCSRPPASAEMLFSGTVIALSPRAPRRADCWPHCR
jgi:hypothetical protein